MTGIYISSGTSLNMGKADKDSFIHNKTAMTMITVFCVVAAISMAQAGIKFTETSITGATISGDGAGLTNTSAYITVCPVDCDYTTDGTADEVQIEAAINDPTVKKTVYIGKGDYSISTPIDFVSDTSMIIAGNLTWDGAASTQVLNISGGSETNRIENVYVRFEGGKILRSTSWAYGIMVSFADNVRIIDGYVDGNNLGLPLCMGCSENTMISKNLWVIGGTYKNSGSNNPAAEVAGINGGGIKNTYLYNGGSRGLNAVNLDNFIISNNIINKTRNIDGIFVGRVSYSEISNNIIRNASQHGIQISKSGGVNSQYLDVSNNIIQDVNNSGIYLGYVNSMNVFDNYIKDVQVGIETNQRSVGVMIKGNSIYNPTQNGMNLTIISSTVSDNYIRSPQRMGIDFTSPLEVIITGNQIFDPSTETTQTWPGINIGYDGANNPATFYITNNMIIGTSRKPNYGVKIAAESNNYVITGNVMREGTGYITGYDAADTKTIAPNYDRTGNVTTITNSSFVSPTGDYWCCGVGPGGSFTCQGGAC